MQVPLARVLSEEEEDDDDEVDDDPEDDEVWEDPTGGLVTRLFNLASDGKLEDLALLLDGLDSSTVNLQGAEGCCMHMPRLQFVPVNNARPCHRP